MKNKYVTHKHTTTTELQAPDLGQAHAYRIKHVSGIQTLPITWESGITVQHKNELYKSVEKALTHQMDKNTSGRGRVLIHPDTKRRNEQI